MSEYLTIKKDLEEVVEEEVKILTSLVECPRARVSEDTVYFEFRVEGSRDLPAKLDNPRIPAPTMITYIPKYHVTVVEFKVEYVRENDVPLAMAIVRYYFTSTVCFKDYLVIPANIEDIALEIIRERGGGG